MASGSKSKKREITLPLELRQGDDGWAVVPLIVKDKLDEWCLYLCMIASEVLTRVDVTNNDRSVILSLRLDRRHRDDRVWLARAGQRLEVGLPCRELASWIHLFHRYRALGRADVDHIDVDVDDHEPGPERVSALILRVDRVKPPMKWGRFIKAVGMAAEQAEELLTTERQGMGGSTENQIL